MFESLNARLSVVVFVFAISLAWTMPNFMDTSGMWWPSQDKLSYGLDIQGGLHLVLGIDVDSAVEARINKMSFSMKKQLLEEKQVTLGEVKLIDAKEAKVQIYFNPSDKEKVVEYIDKVNLHIKACGLEEFRKKLPYRGTTELSVSMLLNETKIVKNLSIAYRGAEVEEYAMHFLCHSVYEGLKEISN